MTELIADRLAERTVRDFIGRRDELASLRRLIRGESPELIAFVHGPGGIGKSRLVRAALEEARDAAHLVTVECASAEPTPASFLAALGADPSDAPADAAARIGSRAERVVLALDGYERFVLLDAWLRSDFVPHLPTTVRMIISGRDGPRREWLTTPGWEGLVVRVALGELPRSDAAAMLRRRGLSGRDADGALDFAGGHPLALELMASTRHGPPPRDRGAAPPEVIDELVLAFLDGLDGELEEAVTAAAVVQRVNEPMLTALLERPGSSAIHRRLASLPFVDSTEGGLELHDIVRASVAADLARRDPALHMLLRRRAARALMPQLGVGGERRSWQTTAELLHLIQHPIVRGGFFPPGPASHGVEPATRRDARSIRDIASEWCDAGEVEVIDLWWRRHPELFVVARDEDGGVAGFSIVGERSDVDEGLLQEDPAARTWTADLERDPAPAGSRVVMVRQATTRDDGYRPSPALAALWIDTKRQYLALRPMLSRVYVGRVGDDTQAQQILASLGFVEIERSADGAGPRRLDFGTGSVDGWLARVLETELGSSGPERVERSDSPVALLTRREREVLGLIVDGLSNRDIADRLVLSEKTVSRHVANTFLKLGVHNRASAVRIALESGLS